jgi:hypothetical protein
MFGAIGTTNPELIQLVNDAHKAGVDKAFYREFTAEVMDRLIKESHTIRTSEDRETYYAEAKGQSASQALGSGELKAILSDALAEARTLEQDITTRPEPDNPSTWQTRLKTMRPPTVKSLDRPQNDWLNHLRGFLYSHQGFHDPVILNPVIHDLFSNFAEILGIPLSDITVDELGNIDNTLEWAIKRSRR